MCAKNHLLIFSSVLDIWENVEWPRFFGPPGILHLELGHSSENFYENLPIGPLLTNVVKQLSV